MLFWLIKCSNIWLVAYIINVLLLLLGALDQYLFIHHIRNMMLLWYEFSMRIVQGYEFVWQRYNWIFPYKQVTNLHMWALARRFLCECGQPWTTDVNVNVVVFAIVPLQSSSSEVLSSATRRPLIETGASSVLVWNRPTCWLWWLM